MRVREDQALIQRLLATPLAEVLSEACARRDARWPQMASARMTYSRKVFIPLTRLCQDVCHYCTFATTPSNLAAPFLTPEEVLDIARQGAETGC